MIIRHLEGKDCIFILVCMILVVAQVFLDLTIPQYMERITTALQMGTSTDVIVTHGKTMVLYAFLSLLASVCAGACAAKAASSLGRTLRRKQFENVSRFSKQDMDRFSASSLFTRSTNDVYTVQMFHSRSIITIVKAPLTAILAIAVISTSNWMWTAATTITVLVVILSLAAVLSVSIPRVRRIQGLMDRIGRSSKENIEGIRVVRAYNAEKHQELRFETENGEMLSNNIRLNTVMSLMPGIASGANNFLTLAIYLIGASIIMGSSHMDQIELFSEMIMFTAYSGMIVNSIIILNFMMREMSRSMVSSARIEEVIGYEATMCEGNDEPPEEAGTVSFRNVSFRYPSSDRMVLEDISFDVGKGSFVAIIGPTGSGKTTLASLVLRLMDPTSGTVLVDGLDVRDYRYHDLHSRISYMAQKAPVFSDTVRNNVCLGHDPEDVDDEDVWRALSIAQADEFVQRLPKGLDTEISQHGRDLSGGQKQRISVARAIYHGAGIMVFDDTFSALDFKTDRNLRESISEQLPGTTRIVVAQRVNTIMDADMILVLDGGRLVGSGTHAELLENCPLYRDIAESQMLSEVS